MRCILPIPPVVKEIQRTCVYFFSVWDDQIFTIYCGIVGWGIQNDTTNVYIYIYTHDTIQNKSKSDEITISKLDLPSFRSWVLKSLLQFCGHLSKK